MSMQSLLNPVGPDDVRQDRPRDSQQASLKRLPNLSGSTSYLGVKRVLDILGAGLLLVALSPLLLLIAIAIRCESTGPVLFSQFRCGQNGQQFRFWKFRSMVVDAESRRSELLLDNVIRFKMKRDPRITRVGRFIRKYSMDELPQLWNVINGDMSLVGPRPPLPQEVNSYTDYQRQRLSVVPGITCTWQIGGRSNITFEDQVELDLEYIRTRSFWNDLRILIKTPFAVIAARGAF